MSFCTINGIALPIRDGSLKQSTQDIGERGQAFDGTAYQAIRARKRKWQFSTTPMTQADSLAWSALISGQGVNWSFEADAYSLQGHAATLTNAARSTTQKKFGSASLLVQDASGASAQWTVGTGSAWTVAYWARYDGVYDFRHFVINSAGSKWLNGVSTSLTLTATVSGGILSISRLSGIPCYYDDLFFLPAVVPTSWPAQMYAHGAQLVDASGFTLGGDIVPASVACVGQVTGSKVMQVIVGGSFVSNAVELDVEITEA